MAYTVSGGRLLADGIPVPYRPSPNIGGACRPRFLIMHFTAGGYSGAVSWLCDPDAKASAHLVIGEAGEVTQLVPFDRAAWHAGRSSWRGVTAMNSNSIGIELANYGELDGGPGHWTFSGRHVPDERVYVGRHKHGGASSGWHTYPLAQVETALAIAEALAQVETALAIAEALHRAYGFEDVAGHDDIAPGRKTDPGPAFDLVSFRHAVLADGDVASPKPVQTTRRVVAVVTRKDVQAALNALGYGPLDEDGDIGPASKAAVERFQRVAGIGVDGDPGPKTKAALEAALARL